MKLSTTLELDFSAPSETEFESSVVITGRRVRVSPVFYAYWRFAAERQDIFFRRLGRANYVTADPVLAQFKFTNAYRASDRVSQYLIRHVIYGEDAPQSTTDLFFRILLFKIFNRIETWEYLEDRFGHITYADYDFEHFDDALSSRMSSGHRIYSAAYIMPSAGSAFGYKAKHQNHLCLIEQMIRENFPDRLASSKAMSEAFDLLLSAPSIGRFLAYQYVTDVNYSPLTNFSESEFVVAGPGALDGIDKCFPELESITPEDVIRYMYENQERHFAEQSIAFRSLWGRRLQLIDCQNVFCEISKYARVAYPEFTGVAGRTRIKQKFAAQTDLPDPCYPPKWNLNVTAEQ